MEVFFPFWNCIANRSLTTWITYESISNHTFSCHIIPFQSTAAQLTTQDNIETKLIDVCQIKDCFRYIDKFRDNLIDEWKFRDLVAYVLKFCKIVWSKNVQEKTTFFDTCTHIQGFQVPTTNFARMKTNSLFVT
jgi:hypothetical protein